MARTKPELRIETLPISEVLPYAKNARLHSDAQVDLVAKSIADFGFVNPCLIDKDGVLIAGHCRVIAAQKLGLKTVPVIRLGYLTEQQARALRLADNALPALASWSQELIKAEIADLKLEGFDIALLGFPENQLRVWGITMGTDTENDPEEVPETPKNPVVRRGDRWILGDHVLVCGDATSKSDVAMCLDGAKPHLMVTDPPYGVDYDPLWRDQTVNRFGPAVARGVVHNDHRVDWTSAWSFFNGDVAYIWHGALHAGEVAINLEKCGFDIRGQIIWAKQNFALSRGDYHWMHEPCWYAVRKSKNGHWEGDRKQTTLWEIDSINPVGGGGKGNDEKIGHGTQKPIECMKRPIENNSRKGDYVYEPFSGSFTTGIACELTGRRCLAIEISEAYVELGILRWERLTGRKATLDGKTLEQVAKARRPGKSKGSVDAPRNPGKSVSGENTGGDDRKRPLRPGLRAGRLAKGRKPAGESPPVAGGA